SHVNTQEYGWRPYGVGFLVTRLDHLFEFSPSSTSFEYFAISIPLRSQSAKTYPEMRFGSCAGCMYFIRLYLPFISLANRNKYVCVGRLEDLIHHGLHSFPSRDSPAGQRVIPFSEPYVLPSN
ncbi:hypothetical protein V8E53_011210, partial [Lactarius tabidus]